MKNLDLNNHKKNPIAMIADLRGDLLKDNSSSYKMGVMRSFIEEHKDDDVVMDVLDMIFNDEKYNLTSACLFKASHEENSLKDDALTIENILDVLHVLKSQDESISCKKSTLNALYGKLSKKSREIIECILDKDFKCGVSKATYRKLSISKDDKIGVALANKYADQKQKVDFKKDVWYASRKLDGCRANIIKQGNNVKVLSRTGKPYLTLQALIDAIKDIPIDFVLDGEVITESGLKNDDFKSIVSQIKRKDYAIQDPVMMVFDMYSIDVAYGREKSDAFSKRYDNLQAFFSTYKDALKDRFVLVEQKKVDSEDKLMEEFKQANAKGWEGLMIRKDTVWEGKRTNNLLKIKEFNDGEFTIVDYVLGDFYYKGDTLKNVLAAVMVESEDGVKAKVGSGWSLEERKRLATCPQSLIGKTIKVKYFETTADENGALSLRFPTKVFLYENEEGRFD